MKTNIQRINDFLTHSSQGNSDSNLKTPAAWCDKFGIEIIDNDGWNRRNPHCMEVPISQSEFISRYFVSTGRIVDRVKYAQYQYLF